MVRIEIYGGSSTWQGIRVGSYIAISGQGGSLRFHGRYASLQSAIIATVGAGYPVEFRERDVREELAAWALEAIVGAEVQALMTESEPLRFEGSGFDTMRRNALRDGMDSQAAAGAHDERSAYDGA